MPLPTIVTYRPRPDQPLRNDQQNAYFESKHPGVTWLLGGNGAGTTFTTCAKIVKFLLETPPPRKDCPIWLISETYEMVCKSVWKEKLSPRDGYGLLPDSEIDWLRVRWLRSSQGWPSEVPLKPQPGRPGKNFILSFKSYKQGRAQMQAESIGGFCFFEQFPQVLLEEVLRGCREYAFEGNKLCEQTPIDPSMSSWLQDLEENDELPEGWHIYRANTECALEAGHVTQQWFNQFFGMIAPEMRGVRMMGLWGGFQGSIYPEFDTAVHCIQGEWTPPKGYHHIRMIDWGFGVDNAFCCLWACRDGSGIWTIYDEYYSTDTRFDVISHLKAIVDKHFWPDSHFYGRTWADPSNINCHKIASHLSEYTQGEYENIGIQSGVNSVEEGIEHIKWMLKLDPALAIPNEDGTPGDPRPRLMVVRKKCPFLVAQMRTYRKVRSNKTGLNPKDAPDIVLKCDDHTCDALRYGIFSEACLSGVTPRTIAKQHSPKRFGIHLENGSRK